MNKAIIIGRLGGEPEVKTFDSGNSITSFSVATTARVWNKETEEYEKGTDWHKVVAFGKRGEAIAKYLTKGDGIGIEGRIEYRTWEDDQGVKRYMTQIVTENFEFLPKGASTTDETVKGAEVTRGNVKNHAPQFDTSEEIPF